MGKAGVFCHGKGRHRKAGKCPLQHQRQRPQSAHPGRELHAGGEAEVSRKIAAQPDDRKGTAVRVF